MKNILYASLLAVAICGCGNQTNPEAADLQNSEVTTPEGGGEPVLTEEGP